MTKLSAPRHYPKLLMVYAGADNENEELQPESATMKCDAALVKQILKLRALAVKGKCTVTVMLKKASIEWGRTRLPPEFHYFIHVTSTRFWITAGTDVELDPSGVSHALLFSRYLTAPASIAGLLANVPGKHRASRDKYCSLRIGKCLLLARDAGELHNLQYLLENPG